MAVGDYLVKVGSYEIPLKYMSLESYSATYSTTDLDSTRTADGTLTRNALSHRVLKVEFTTPTGYLSDLEVLLSNIKAQYTNAIEKKLKVSAYVPEECGYVEQVCYVPDISVSIMQNSKFGFIVSGTRIAFIGY